MYKRQAPEQAKGKPVDQRADIWAFGVVLFEMVTGKPLFEGESTTEILASVIKEEPQWERAPVEVRRLLRRCLEKDPQKRLRHIGDAMALWDAVSYTHLDVYKRQVQKMTDGYISRVDAASKTKEKEILEIK